MKARVHHFQTEVALAHVAKRSHAPAGSESLLLTRIEVEKTQHELRRAVFE